MTEPRLGVIWNDVEPPGALMFGNRDHATALSTALRYSRTMPWTPARNVRSRST